jgi:hypothetical protein
MVNSRQGTRGGSALEVALSTLFWVPLLIGTSVTGLNIIRALQISEIWRDAGHMFAYGVDFAQTPNQDLVLRTAKGLNITRTGGTGVIILSKLMYVGATECTGAGLTADTVGCPNIFKTVFVRRIVIGNASVRASDYGTPKASIVKTDGTIAPNDYLKDSTAVAKDYAGNSFSLMSLSGGQVTYMTETYFTSPDYDWGRVMSGTGDYARCFF